MAKIRNTLNPNSQLLSKAIVGCAGLGLPSDVDVPAGMAAVLLLVPVSKPKNFITEKLCL